jgi:AraC-like DNA-binding protein
LRLYPQRRWVCAELAAECGLSETQLFRRFKQLTGTSPQRFLRRERISRAKSLLAEGEQPIGEVAAQVGYDDPLYFSRDFSRAVGCPPRTYRRREQAG